MGTIPTPSPAPTQTKLQNILSIINIALGALTAFGGPVAAGGAFGGVLVGILSHALQAYQQETGQPIDLNKIPLEALVP